MSTINVNTISDAAGSGAPNFPDGVQVAGNNVATAGSLSNRNRIINGNFDIWQRGTSGTTQYVADRWKTVLIGSTAAISRQSFTLGQTDVPYEPEYFHRVVVTSSAGSGNVAVVQQPIESVRTFAGQTVTISFWAKADASKNIAFELAQNFGTGGSPSSEVTAIGVTTCSLTTSWQKFTATASMPSISGKTLGTDGNDNLLLTFWLDAGSDWNSRNNSLGQQSGTFDIAQVQLEAGDVATPFEMRTVGQELALCQRYYQTGRSALYSARSVTHRTGMVAPFPVKMRAAPAVATTIYSSKDYNSGFSVSSTADGIDWTAVMNSSVDAILAFVYSADAEL